MNDHPSVSGLVERDLAKELREEAHRLETRAGHVVARGGDLGTLPDLLRAKSFCAQAASTLEAYERACRRCDGTGTARITVKAGLVSRYGGDEDTTISGPCRDCAGTGTKA